MERSAGTTALTLVAVKRERWAEVEKLLLWRKSDAKIFRVSSTKATAFTQHESGNFKEEYHLQPTGLATQVSDNMTFSKSPKDLLTVKVNVIIMAGGPCRSEQQDCL